MMGVVWSFLYPGNVPLKKLLSALFLNYKMKPLRKSFLLLLPLMRTLILVLKHSKLKSNLKESQSFVKVKLEGARGQDQEEGL